KPINDTVGHAKGDEVLRHLAGIFRKQVRDTDVVSRHGGDEFLITIDGADDTDAEVIMKRIHQAVAAYDPNAEHPLFGPLRVGVSIGYACFPADGETCEALLATADSRMYASKAERKQPDAPLRTAA